MGCTAPIVITICITLTGAIVANLTAIPVAMDCVMMKMLQFHLKRKDGQTVQSLGTTSLDFIAVLVETYLEILTNFAAVRWLLRVKNFKCIMLY